MDCEPFYSQFEKAISCIHAIESSCDKAKNAQIMDTFLPTILYAKFTVLLQDEDFVEAEAALRSLLQAGKTPFKSAMHAVKSFVVDSWQFLTTAAGNSKLEFFKLLSYKYPW